MSEGVRELWLRVPGAEGQLRSLMDWLRHEDGLRGRVRACQSPPAPGEMGGALDALAVAVGSGWSRRLGAGYGRRWSVVAAPRLTTTPEPEGPPEAVYIASS
ncbi:effector-associated constant component EACC1 [Streptomyces noursei]|uniref:effector-associated constant component EACC1 n=1 Tax=Streptomyces noursei TaxID=1971 RepID=UPI0038295774